MSQEHVVILDPVAFSTNVKSPRANITSASSSPYDVPEALRAYLDDNGKIVIEIKYIGSDEPLETINIQGGMQVKTGRNSKRLYEFITGGFDAPKLSELHAAVEKLIDGELFSRKDNYRLLENVLETQGARIQEALVFDKKRA
ncbi:MAG: hypothetical protein ACO1PN_04300 [Betaproteobacteria bacterium]